MEKFQCLVQSRYDFKDANFGTFWFLVHLIAPACPEQMFVNNTSIAEKEDIEI